MITMHFQFFDGQEEDLVLLNRLLADMDLQDLDLEDPDGYLMTATDAQGNLLEHRYGLFEGKLVCNLAKGSQKLHYQIDTAVTPRSVDRHAYLDDWRKAHPHRTIRIAQMFLHDEMVGYVIVHHQKLTHEQ